MTISATAQASAQKKYLMGLEMSAPEHAQEQRQVTDAVHVVDSDTKVWMQILQAQTPNLLGPFALRTRMSKLVPNELDAKAAINRSSHLAALVQQLRFDYLN